jgi:hypothetical protein
VGIVYDRVAGTDVPMALVAFTDTVIEDPAVRPVMEQVRVKAPAGMQVPIELVVEYDWREDPPSVKGADQETWTELDDVASMCNALGADGSARGITKADVVLFIDSITDVLVTVTIFASYKRDGSRFVNLATRDRVVKVRTRPFGGLNTIFCWVYGLNACALTRKDCTVMGEPKAPPRSRRETSYWTNDPSPYVLGSSHDTSRLVEVRVPVTD